MIPSLEKGLLVSHVSKAFPAESGARREILNEISFTVESGMKAAILGKSGCGKTTLLNIIAGFEQADLGEVKLCGACVSGPSDRQAVVFQSPALFPWLNVLQNVAYGLRRQGVEKAQREQAAREMLRKVGLQEFEAYYPYQLSGGMQQRVALARVFVMRPPLLLMDEPFAALDAQLRDQMQLLLLKLCEDYQPMVLFVTHDVEEAIRIADQILFLDGQPAEIAREIPVSLTYEQRTCKEGQIEIAMMKDKLKQQLFGGA